jgi:hypothetical protein
MGSVLLLMFSQGARYPPCDYTMFGIEAMGQAGTPPPRTVIGDPSQCAVGAETVRYPSVTNLPSVSGTKKNALGHHAIADEVPERDQKLAR